MQRVTIGWLGAVGLGVSMALCVVGPLATVSCSSERTTPAASGGSEAGTDVPMEGGADVGPSPGDASTSSDAPSSDGEVSDAGAESGTVGTPTLPTLLSQTGLFKSIAADGTLVLEDGVQEYQPLNPLWADGAQKTRWVLLPPGSKIDTSDPDHWSFPAGTKFWKEFALDGQRLETRLLWIYGPGANDFLVAAYWWNPEAGIPNDAELADPFVGEQNVNGTSHDIPSQQDCHSCHDSLQEHVLGFGAIELNHTLPGANIHTLMEAGVLTTEPSLPSLAIPGDQTAQAALGYLHTNCGICHNATPGANDVPAMFLRLAVGTATVQGTETYTTAVNQPTTGLTTVQYRIQGQDPAMSEVIVGMLNRGGRDQMPPLASNEVDDAGIATVSAWINTLPKP